MADFVLTFDHIQASIICYTKSSMA